MITILFWITLLVLVIGLVLGMLCAICACMLSSQISRDEERGRQT